MVSKDLKCNKTQIYIKTETDSDVENKLMVISREREERRGKIMIGDYETQTTVYKNKQQEYIVQHGEIQPLFCNNLKWNIIYKNVDSLCCTPETNFVNQLYSNFKNVIRSTITKR